MDSGDDIVESTFCTRFMVCELVNGDHFSIMGEHHDSK